MAMTLLATNTESGDSTSDFTSLIDSTYKLYIFKLIDINLETAEADLQVQFNVAAASGFNEEMTTTYFYAIQAEADNDTGFSYVSANDQASGTAYQTIMDYMGSGSDESGAGTLWLFDPSNTTYITHFYSVCNSMTTHAYTNNIYVAGYVNAAGAIDEVSFKPSSGNFDGTIKMYGVG